jgi:hypothetical protein
MRRYRAILACAAIIASIVVPSARVSSADPGVIEHSYYVGVNGAYLPNLKQDTIRRWVRETGATMPRVGMRMDLFQKGMPDHPDAMVTDAAAAGGSALAMLFNEHQSVTRPDGTKDEGCKPPEGLWEPVFDSGSDDAAAGAKINPRNEWAVFVAAMAERYDGDGVADAPGSPKVTYFSVWNEPDWLPWPNRPKDPNDKTMRNWFGRNYADLARLAFVSHRAARSTNPVAKVGMQLCFNQSVGLLLDDAKHPLAKNCDFIDFHAYGGKGSDDNCFRNDGILPVWRQMCGEYEKRKLPLPQFLCTESGVGGGEPGSEQEQVQAAAVIKANVVGASAGLVTVCWYALVDPSWENMGLIADASKLPADGAGARKRDAFAAMQTAAKLLPPSTRFVAEISTGEGAHAYRFRDAEGRDLVVAWADDAKGWGAKARVVLPKAGAAWDVLTWDLAKPAVQVRRMAAGEGVAVEVTTMPVFFRAAGVGASLP